MSLWVIAIVFHVALIVAAYKIGENRAGRGVALFFVGAFGFQLFVNGPSSFIEGGCQHYSQIAQDC